MSMLYILYEFSTIRLTLYLCNCYIYDVMDTCTRYIYHIYIYIVCASLLDMDLWTIYTHAHIYI